MIDVKKVATYRKYRKHFLYELYLWFQIIRDKKVTVDDCGVQFAEYVMRSSSREETTWYLHLSALSIQRLVKQIGWTHIHKNVTPGVSHVLNIIF